MKINCWEFKKCGREPNGPNVLEFGVCPAALEEKLDGTNSGKNGGRCCWALTGTFCGKKVQGTFAMKMSNCMTCDFFKKVSIEERATKSYVPLAQILQQIK
ncbi:MAG: hypothetical protein P1P88_22750 [Bacteroidales bacterium]|nr:hypothetical protein [Bacteroidales bacterium]